MNIRTPALLAAALAFAAAPAFAQEKPHEAHAPTGAAAAKPMAEHDMAAMHAKMHPAGAAAIKPLYDSFKGWIVAAAEQLPEADYAYAPTSGVRTFGQLFGHVANANYMFCSQGGAGASPNKVDIEKTVTSKADLIAALKAAFAFCDAAYVLPDAQLTGEVELFGMKGSKLWVINFNAVHNAEHYGNLVTYLRMKGMVPPSSQRM
jgi:uncharacterized damage-inducible protein DinB